VRENFWPKASDTLCAGSVEMMSTLKAIRWTKMGQKWLSPAAGSAENGSQSAGRCGLADAALAPYENPLQRGVVDDAAQRRVVCFSHCPMFPSSHIAKGSLL
jgi:hypothetical protein